MWRNAYSIILLFLNFELPYLFFVEAVEYLHSAIRLLDSRSDSKNYSLMPWDFRNCIFRETHPAGLKMGTPRGFGTDLPMQPSGAQMNTEAPGTSYSFVHTSDCSINMLQQDKVGHSFSIQMSVPLMNRMTPENPQPDLFNHLCYLVFLCLSFPAYQMVKRVVVGATWDNRCIKDIFVELSSAILLSYTFFSLRKTLKMKVNFNISSNFRLLQSSDISRRMLWLNYLSNFKFCPSFHKESGEIILPFT